LQWFAHPVLLDVIILLQIHAQTDQLTAQLVEHSTGIAKVMDSSPIHT